MFRSYTKMFKQRGSDRFVKKENDTSSGIGEPVVKVPLTFSRVCLSRETVPNGCFHRAGDIPTLTGEKPPRQSAEQSEKQNRRRDNRGLIFDGGISQRESLLFEFNGSPLQEGWTGFSLILFEECFNRVKDPISGERD